MKVDDDGVVRPDLSLLSMDLDDPRIIAEMKRRDERRRRIGRIVRIAIEIMVAGAIGGATVLLIQALRRLF